MNNFTYEVFVSVLAITLGSLLIIFRDKVIENNKKTAQKSNDAISRQILSQTDKKSNIVVWVGGLLAVLLGALNLLDVLQIVDIFRSY